MSSDRIGESVQQDESMVRLQLQLQQVLHSCAELELQVLNSRDHAIGTAAKIGELRARIRELEDELSRKNARITRLRKDLEEQGVRFRATATWQIGHFAMLPVRILRRFSRSS